MQPVRAANISGVRPPCANSLGRGSLLTLRVHSRTVERASTSAPFASNSLTISGCNCAPAHINAV